MMDIKDMREKMDIGEITKNELLNIASSSELKSESLFLNRNTKKDKDLNNKKIKYNKEILQNDKNEELTFDEDLKTKCSTKIESSKNTCINEFNTFICNICFKSFEKEKNLRRHMSIHSDSKRFKCEYEGCNNEYKRLDHLKRHLISHSENKKPFECNKCIMRFTNKDHLKRHIENMHGFDVNDVETTNISNNNSLNLNENSDERNENVKPLLYRCVLCNLNYNKKSKLNFHYLDKHIDDVYKQMNEVNPVNIQDSNKSMKNLKINLFPLKFLLKKIKNIKICPFLSCKKIFSTKSKYDKHIKANHNRIAKLKYFTPNNKHSFNVANELLNTKSINTNEYSINSGKLLTFNQKNRVLYKCYHNNCDKAYISKYNLNIHIRNYHNEKKQYECRICKIQYKNKCSLKLHFAKNHQKDYENFEEFQKINEIYSNNNNFDSQLNSELISLINEQDSIDIKSIKEYENTNSILLDNYLTNDIEIENDTHDHNCHYNHNESNINKKLICEYSDDNDDNCFEINNIDFLSKKRKSSNESKNDFKFNNSDEETNCKLKINDCLYDSPFKSYFHN